MALVLFLFSSRLCVILFWYSKPRFGFNLVLFWEVMRSCFDILFCHSACLDLLVVIWLQLKGFSYWFESVWVFLCLFLRNLMLKMFLISKLFQFLLSFAIINLDLFLFVIVLGKVSPCNILADIGLYVELKQTNVNFCASDHTSCQCLVEIQSGVYPGKRICLTWKPRWSFKNILSLSTSWKEKFILTANLYFTPLIPNQNQNFTQLNNLVKSSRTLREHFKMVR